MPQLQIPQKGAWTGQFEGEFSGHFIASRNIDLERNKGKIQLADSFSDIHKSTGVGFSNLTTPVAFVRSSADGTDRWWANAGRLFKSANTNPESTYAADAISGTPTAPLYDMIDFLGDLIVPLSTDLARNDGGTWSSTFWTGLSGASALQAVPHRFAIFSGALVFTNGRFINDYDGTTARDPALTLPVGFEARWLLPWKDILFIGGANTVGQEASVYIWQRDLTTYAAEYKIGDNEALCGFVAGGVPHIVTKKGAIKRYNGQGFELVQQFPSVELNREISSIHPNGVSVQENLARMLVNFGTSENFKILSGLWTFDAQNFNLYHSGSVRNTSGNDYAQGELADVGALRLTVPTQGSYLIGARTYTNYSGTSVYGIYTADEDTTSNRGYILSPKIPASSIRNYWRYITPKVFRFDNAGDRLRIYFRQEDSNSLPLNSPDYETITWVAANQFTASNSDIAVGDLVEVIAGDNAGALERITAISGTTVTIANSLFASANQARVRYLRFNEIGSISSQAVQEQRFIVSARSNWVQFLFQLIGSETSPSLEKILLEFNSVPV